MSLQETRPVHFTKKLYWLIYVTFNFIKSKYLSAQYYENLSEQYQYKNLSEQVNNINASILLNK